MSTGLDCGFRETKPGEWFYDLEQAPGTKMGDTLYDTYGPFPSFDAAETHLHENHANPGGFWLQRHPESTEKVWGD